MSKARVGIIGASGYTGGELLRILAGHPQVEIAFVTAERHAGKKVADVFPSLRGTVGSLALVRSDEVDFEKDCDFAFSALPHHASAELAGKVYESGKPVVDLSADFRFEQLDVYEAWYGQHPRSDLLPVAVYGLPELHREKIRKARLVANPGCYVTSVVLGLAPFLKSGLIEPGDILSDSKSGASGAGRSANEDLLYTEVNEGLRPYKAGNHRHQPEIEKELAALCGTQVEVTFVPHLLPISRGILSTIYCRPKNDFSVDKAYAVLESAYANEPFVRLVAPGGMPNAGHVRGSNFCDIGVHYEKRANRLIVFSALDNLGKGAAGQAVQNMNLMLGIDETAGIQSLPVFP